MGIIFAESAGAKVKIAVDHPFLRTSLEDLFPGEFEILHAYSSANMHLDIGLRPSQMKNLHNSDYFFTLHDQRNLGRILPQNVVFFNPAECARLSDKHCEKDKHFWLSQGAVLQIYQNITAFVREHNLSGNFRNSSKIISEINSLNIAEMLAKCGKNIYTEHAFHARLGDYTNFIAGNIFDNHGNLIPSQLDNLLVKSGILLVESGIESGLKKKLQNSGVKVYQFDADGAGFSHNKAETPECKSQYCLYIQKNFSFCGK